METIKTETFSCGFFFIFLFKHLVYSYLSYFKAMVKNGLNIMTHSIESPVRVPDIGCRRRQQALCCRLYSNQ